MVVHCTVYILNIIMMINQEKGKEVVSKYKGKGGYSVDESYFYKNVLKLLNTMFAIFWFSDRVIFATKGVEFLPQTLIF